MMQLPVTANDEMHDNKMSAHASFFTFALRKIRARQQGSNPVESSWYLGNYITPFSCLCQLKSPHFSMKAFRRILVCVQTFNAAHGWQIVLYIIVSIHQTLHGSCH